MQRSVLGLTAASILFCLSATTALAAGPFTDNGDGTITDASTGLMWEKKSDDGSVHDKDNTYTWSTAAGAMDGTISTTFLAALNAGGGFAGHTDWRIPTKEELLAITNSAATDPAAFAEFQSNCTSGCTATTGSCTKPNTYWSSSTNEELETDAWYVDFEEAGHSYAGRKTGLNHVRAVRAGS